MVVAEDQVGEDVGAENGVVDLMDFEELDGEGVEGFGYVLRGYDEWGFEDRNR